MAALDVLSKIGGQAGGSIIGNVAKAIIEIEDERVQPEEITVTRERSRSISGGALLGGGVLKSITQAAGRARSNSLPPLPSNLPQLVSQNVPTAEKKKRRFRVKFNPSEITFQANGGNRVARTNFTSGGNQAMHYVEMKPRIQIRVPLIFDDYERTETFMMEKFSDPTAILRTGATAAVSAVTKRVYSVRPQVEGFIGALRNTHTRKLTFYWGNLCYKGILNELSASYTMFSIEGRPVRAVVSIGFICSDETEADGNMGQWMTSYRKAFEGTASRLESVTQNVGNLFNINL